MSKVKAFRRNTHDRTYTALRDLTAQDIITKAKELVAARFRRGHAIPTPAATKEYFLMHLADADHEVFACLFLDTRHRIIAFEKLFFGTIDGATVHVRVVVQRALAYNAAAVICTHNHPSGVSEPSEADRSITAKLSKALALVDIRLLDHIIVGDGATSSLAEMGWI